MRTLSIKNISGTSINIKIDHYADQCPICKSKISPYLVHANYVESVQSLPSTMEIAFQCTSRDCRSMFISYFEYANVINGTSYYELSRSAPIHYKKRDFSEEIFEISKMFTEIYDQSYAAEQNGLNHIAGIGYRKAMEFLVKDYLIYLDPDNIEKTKRTTLGQCIKNIENEKIKLMADRAAWLGNDEAHYIRKWKDKDISDLKTLIEIIQHHISLEITSERLLKEMPKD
ncbi:DUF4145 domain-containing protein [Alkalicoccus daliensis]|uniref:DUF4145 domain-containing protein n=1 Tax=Alkalicoccus daliensis TaxID=745820 RepID=A0A1H0FSE1_9BACI|nr:DUF4145 domain-containing protein [Alkalicoccus daliensis]SDN97555.1 protein of unknown function [Alkalicoccus daliensis]